LSDAPEKLSEQQIRELILKAVGDDGWTPARLLEPPILVLAAATLVQLFGLLHSHWGTFELILLYFAELTVFVFWYGLRATVISASAEILTGILTTYCIVAGMLGVFVFLFLPAATFAAVGAGSRSLWLSVLVVFLAYGWHAVARLMDSEEPTDSDATRLGFIAVIYTGWSMVPMLQGTQRWNSPKTSTSSIRGRRDRNSSTLPTASSVVTSPRSTIATKATCNRS